MEPVDPSYYRFKGQIKANNTRASVVRTRDLFFERSGRVASIKVNLSLSLSGPFFQVMNARMIQETVGKKSSKKLLIT
jgi:hypothetical protein